MNNSRAVVDSSLTVFQLLDTEQSDWAVAAWNHLQAKEAAIYVPRLWVFEVTSTVHKYLFDGEVTLDEAERALEAAFELSVNIMDEDMSLCRAAFRWASRLKQKAAYDGFYLAVAEALNADFWTADRRLANAARQLGVTWVHWMGKIK